jgi:hypothetical protein
MLKFGNIGVFVGFQGDTQLRKIRPQITFSLVLYVLNLFNMNMKDATTSSC